MFVDVDERRRGYRVVLHGMRTCIVVRPVTFNEQSLVDAMKSDIGMELRKPSVMDIPTVSTESKEEVSDAQLTQFSSQNNSRGAQSNTDSSTNMLSGMAQSKFSGIDGHTSLVSSKSLLTKQQACTREIFTTAV